MSTVFYSGFFFFREGKRVVSGAKTTNSGGRRSQCPRGCARPLDKTLN
jgi:hypothetical protein